MRKGLTNLREKNRPLKASVAQGGRGGMRQTEEEYLKTCDARRKRENASSLGILRGTVPLVNETSGNLGNA